MSIKKISKSIILNIIGTANLVRACYEMNIKIIYFSSSYVYPGKGDYKETDPVCRGIIMHGQKWVGSVRLKCIKFHNTKSMYD